MADPAANVHCRRAVWEKWLHGLDHLHGSMDFREQLNSSFVWIRTLPSIQARHRVVQSAARLCQPSPGSYSQVQRPLVKDEEFPIHKCVSHGGVVGDWVGGVSG